MIEETEEFEVKKCVKETANIIKQKSRVFSVCELFDAIEQETGILGRGSRGCIEK